MQTKNMKVFSLGESVKVGVAKSRTDGNDGKNLEA